MLVLRSNSITDNESLPIFHFNELDSLILKMGPSAWLDPNIVLSTGPVSELYDKTGSTTWVPQGSQQPTIDVKNNIKFLKFNSASDAQALKSSGNKLVFGKNENTIVILTKVPTGTSGGILVGNKETDDTKANLRVQLRSDSYDGQNVFAAIRHGSGSSVYTINSSFDVADLDSWNIDLFEIKSGASKWYRNGVLKASSEASFPDFETDLARQVLFGANLHTDTLKRGFIGDIAAALVFPRLLSFAEKSTVLQKLESYKDILNS